MLEKRQCHQEPSPKAGLEQVVNCSRHPVPNNGSCAEATFLHSGPISWCNQIYIQVANTPFCVLKQSAEAKSFPLCFQFHRYHQGLFHPLDSRISLFNLKTVITEKELDWNEDLVSTALTSDFSLSSRGGRANTELWKGIDGTVIFHRDIGQPQHRSLGAL